MRELRGELVTLRPIAQEDLPALHRWLNDPEVMQWWDGRDHPATFDRVEARFRKSIEGHDRDAERYMIDCEHGGARRTIGMVQHGRLHPRARNAQIDVLIGEPEFRESGYGTDALRTMLKHLFEDLRANRVWHTMRAANQRAMGAAEKVGFTREGVLRQHDWLEGQLVDVVVYGMLASEWKRAQ